MKKIISLICAFSLMLGLNAFAAQSFPDDFGDVPTEKEMMLEEAENLFNRTEINTVKSEDENGEETLCVVLDEPSLAADLAERIEEKRIVHSDENVLVYRLSDLYEERVCTGSKILLSINGKEIAYVNIILHGDISADGKIDIFDLVKIRSYIVNNEKTDDCLLLASLDCNGDGYVDILDVITIRNKIVNM